MKQATFFILILLVLSFSLNACSVVESLLPSTPTPASGTLLFEDDFSVTPNGWGTMDNSGGEIGFDYQGLTINVDIPNTMVTTINGGKYTDTRIEADAVLLEGPSNDNFGVICRFNDNENYYAFVISHDGYFGVFKKLDGKINLGTIDSNLEYSDAIRKGGVVNHITATCQGEILSLTVNDTLLTQIQDTSFTEGRVGLIASAYSDPGVTVLFDNLKIFQP